MRDRRFYEAIGIDFIDLSDGESSTVDIRFISDTHDRHQEIHHVAVDAIVHSGDETSSRDPHINANLARDFFFWYTDYPAPIKLYVPGNHSIAVQNTMVSRDTIEVLGIRLLVNQETSLYGYKVYGSPCTPLFGHCAAYMMKRQRMKMVWDVVPSDTQILITHGPPKGILDLAPDIAPGSDIVQVGCKSLRNRVEEVRPIIHAFGHLHDASDELLNYGVLRRDGTTFINASCCNLKGEMKHQGVVVRLPKRT